MTVAAMYTAASSQAHASKTCKAHQRPCTQHKVCCHHCMYALSAIVDRVAAAVYDHQLCMIIKQQGHMQVTDLHENIMMRQGTSTLRQTLHNCS